MGDSCLQRKAEAPPRVASGISIFLLEELGDARLRCAQLKKYIDEAVQLIEKSEHRDHFFEVAGHLLHGIPDTLLRMDKALNAAAMAAAKLDFEETKDDLRPEKAEELEQALEEVRVRRVQRRSDEVEKVMKIPEAIAQLEHLAASIESTSTVNTAALSELIVQLEGASTRTASARAEFASVLRALSASLLDDTDPEQRPSRLMLAGTLRRVLGDTLNLKEAKSYSKDPRWIHAKYPGKASDGTSFKAGDLVLYFPGDHTFMVGKKAEAEWKNVEQGLQDEAVYEATYGDVTREMSANDKRSEDDKQSRFEEGKPADPTKQMSPEDAKDWKQNTEEHKDNFKAASTKIAMAPVAEQMAGAFKEGAKSRSKFNAYELKAAAEDLCEAAKEAVDPVFKPSMIAKMPIGTFAKISDRVMDLAFEMGAAAYAVDEKTASDDEEKRSRFEEGKPVDPTKHMDPGDAQAWKENTDEHKDKFKAASEDPWKVKA